MSYTSIIEIHQSGSLMSRITACAAMEGIENPQDWVMARMWMFAAQPGWAEDWDYARDTYTLEKNPDTGVRPDVISDTDILAAVQALRAANQPV